MKCVSIYIVSLLLFAALPALAARPVARWDVVPYQRVSGTFNAGVCAFHIDGVKVEFFVDGKPALTVENPALNPRTKVWEFFLPLDTTARADGPVTLTARATSLGAKPESYDLPPMPLYANAKGTLTVAPKSAIWVDELKGADSNPGTKDSPMQSLQAAAKAVPIGGTIYLAPGTYSPNALRGPGGDERPYWTTIEAAPGVARKDVEIISGRPGMQRIRWRNVTFVCDPPDKGGYAPILAGEGTRHMVWFDNCKNYCRKGRWAANSNLTNRYVAFVTGGVTFDMCNGPDGVLVRDHVIDTLTSDAWTGSGRLVVNCRCFGIDPGTTGAHPDFHQSYAKEPGWVEDVILYNVLGYDICAQGLFGARLRNSAFVNVFVDRVPKGFFHSQYSGPVENVLFFHVGLVHQPWAWRKGIEPKDIKIRNCLFPSYAEHSPADIPPGAIDIDYCHFETVRGQSYGEHATKGGPMYRDVQAKDFALAQNCSAAGSAVDLQCVPADLYGVPYAKGRRNRGPFATDSVPVAQKPQH